MIYPRPRQIIGFTGRMGAGKSLAAQHLNEDHAFQRTRFAGPLKDMMKCLGLTHEHIEGKLKELPCGVLGGKSPRYAMQTIGTEWGRDIISKSLWIDVWKQKVRDLGQTSVTVEDVRFPNEAEAVREVGGILVHIERGAPVAPSHASEIMDFAADIMIRNDGTVGEFLQRVGELTDIKFTPEGQPYLDDPGGDPATTMRDYQAKLAQIKAA